MRKAGDDMKINRKWMGSKDMPSTRLNKIQNKLSAAQLIKMFDKNEQEFDGLAQSIKNILHPNGPFENMLAESIAHCLFRLRWVKEAEQFFISEATNKEGIRCGDLSESRYFKKVARYRRNAMKSLETTLNDIYAQS